MMAASFLKGFSVIILVLVAVFPPKLCCLEIDVDPRKYGQDTMQHAHSSKTGNYVIRCITHYFELFYSKCLIKSSQINHLIQF